MPLALSAAVPKVTLVPLGNSRLKATVPVGEPAPGATAQWTDAQGHAHDAPLSPLPPALRQRIAYLHQHPYLFRTSVRENIRLGSPQATDEAIEGAARAAEIHDVIMRLPRGYDSPLGDRGARFSGGARPTSWMSALSAARLQIFSVVGRTRC